MARCRVSVALLVVLTFMAIGTGCSLLPAGVVEQYGRGDLVVHSIEEGSVLVDGHPMGLTNDPIRGVQPGERAVSVRADDGTVVFDRRVVMGTNVALVLNAYPETGDSSALDCLGDVSEGRIEEEPEATALGEATPGSDADTRGLAKAWSETVALGTRYQTVMHVYDSGVAGPTLWVNGGVHGNELAGYRAADAMTAWKVRKGRIVVLPRANALAVLANARYVASTGDLNRLFPTTRTARASSTLSRAIQDKVLKYDPDYFIDLHEGADYYSPTSGSVGQTCIYYPAGNAKTIASRIVNEQNAAISSPVAKFHLLQYPTPGSVARWVGQGLGVPAFIFETAAKVNLTTRISYQNRAVSTILSYLGMQ